MGERIWEEDKPKRNAIMEPNILHAKKLEKKIEMWSSDWATGILH